MCLAVPRRVLRVDGDLAEVEWDGEPLWVATAGIVALETGEYVLVHAGLVLDRVSAEEAEQILALQTALMLDTGDIPWADLEEEAAL